MCAFLANQERKDREMSRRSPAKKESLDSLTTREISLTRSCRNLSALIK